MGEPLVYEGTQANELSYWVEFSSGEKYIIFSAVSIEESVNSSYEKDEDDVTKLSISNQDYFVFSNNGIVSAVWRTAQFECHINTNLSKQELTEIIYDYS